MPKVSVNIVAHNEGRFLSQCVESIRKQTFQDWELILVDDGSEDDTATVADRLAAEDSRIKVTRTRHEGISAARNKAIEMSSGKYIALQDASDLSVADRLDKQVAFLDSNPTVAVVSSQMMWFACDPDAAVSLVKFPETTGSISEWFNRGRMAVPHAASMIRREVLRAVDGYDESLPRAVDFHLYLRIHKRHAMAVLPECLYLYRRDSRDSFARLRLLRKCHRYALACSDCPERGLNWFPEYCATRETHWLHATTCFLTDLARFLKVRVLTRRLLTKRKT